LQAHAEAEVAKPVSQENLAQARRRNQLAKELEDDSMIVSSGARLMNRPLDNAKAKFIEDFKRARVVERFPIIESDLADEAQVRWVDDLSIKPKTILQITASEVEAAFLLAGGEAPVSSLIIATKILSSDTGASRGTLADAMNSELEADLVLGHIAALGYRWPPRIAIAVARRITIVLLNRHKFEEGHAP
jgi:hypothetical protein